DHFAHAPRMRARKKSPERRPTRLPRRTRAPIQEVVRPLSAGAQGRRREERERRLAPYGSEPRARLSERGLERKAIRATRRASGELEAPEALHFLENAFDLDALSKDHHPVLDRVLLEIHLAALPLMEIGAHAHDVLAGLALEDLGEDETE